MTQEQARTEAIRRWGQGGTVTFRPGTKDRPRGRLARYKCVVSSGQCGFSPSIEGQGDTWQEAFADAHPR
jgi:hypothetical protein